MNQILRKELIAPEVFCYVVHSPEIARRRKPGQFVILHLSEAGERFPLTIADADSGAGTITLIFQRVGKSTAALARLEEGDCIRDLAGPLGNPTHIERFGHVVCVGGGVGTAPLLPMARALKVAGNRITSIIGGRSKEYVILRTEFEAVSERVIYSTDDGSFGVHGFTSDVLRSLLEKGEHIDAVVAVGPVPMMKAISDLTRPYAIRTIVSLNPIMVDGTGMCGGCRVTVGGKTKFTCVDGPEFDAHQVDFAELMKRQRLYLREESTSMERHSPEECKLGIRK